MNVKYPGLVVERLPSGNLRYRVRVEGNKKRRIRLHVTPEDKQFIEHYHAARAGIELVPEMPVEERGVKGSIAWLKNQYVDHLEKQVKAGLLEASTLKQTKTNLELFTAHFGEYDLNMPRGQMLAYRDSLIETPARADRIIINVRGMYRWAREREMTTADPTKNIPKIHKGNGGALPWTIADFERFRQTHPIGTAAWLRLAVFMFTACRISDAIRLGRHNELRREDPETGQDETFLSWQPKKKGSKRVDIWMAPALFEATRAATVQGQTYLLTEHGRPFSSTNGLANRFKKDCEKAGLGHLSSHGVRKGIGNLLAEGGSSQYGVMAVHGHSEARTSEVYTERVRRAELGARAMKGLKLFDD